jgi:GNAT superfamily N-acetyltransferase
MSDAHPIAVGRLTPAARDDYLAFFDHERGAAFADNPEWARCYCLFYRLPRTIDWPGDAARNRTAIDAALVVGEHEGYLARAEGEVVGWLNAQPRHKLPHCFERMRIPVPPLDVPDHEAAVIVCFVVAAGWRKRGVATALLDFALADFAERGLRVVDAFPFRTEGSADPTDHYHGPASLFAARGFERVARHEDLDVMRLRLASPEGVVARDRPAP